MVTHLLWVVSFGVQKSCTVPWNMSTSVAESGKMHEQQKLCSVGKFTVNRKSVKFFTYFFPKKIRHYTCKEMGLVRRMTNT